MRAAIRKWATRRAARDAIGRKRGAEAAVAYQDRFDQVKWIRSQPLVDATLNR